MKDNLSPANLIDRLTSETPKFWKKILWLMVGVGATSGAIVALPLAIPGIVLPAIITAIASKGIVIGATGAALAKLTKVDLPKEDQ